MRLALLTLILGAVLGIGGYRAWEHRLDGIEARRSAEMACPYTIEGGRWVFVAWGHSEGDWVRSEREVRGVDLATFRPLNLEYAVDLVHAYADGQQIPGADAASFHVVHGPYAADKADVYYGVHGIGASPGTFRLVRDDWYRDATRLYFAGRCIGGMDPDSLQFFLTIPWMRDRSDIYRGYTPVHAEEPNTFVPLSYSWGRDAKAYYSAPLPKLHPQDRVFCDYASMVVLDDTYAKDKDRGYFFGYPLPGSDGATFHVIGYDLAEDKTGRYHGYQRVSGSQSELAEQSRLESAAKQVLERRAERTADKAVGKP